MLWTPYCVWVSSELSDFLVVTFVNGAACSVCDKIYISSNREPRYYEILRFVCLKNMLNNAVTLQWLIVLVAKMYAYTGYY